MVTPITGAQRYGKLILIPEAPAPILVGYIIPDLLRARPMLRRRILAHMLHLLSLQAIRLRAMPYHLIIIPRAMILAILLIANHIFGILVMAVQVLKKILLTSIIPMDRLMWI